MKIQARVYLIAHLSGDRCYDRYEDTPHGERSESGKVQPEVVVQLDFLIFPRKHAHCRQSEGRDEGYWFEKEAEHCGCGLTGGGGEWVVLV